MVSFCKFTPFSHDKHVQINSKNTAGLKNNIYASEKKNAQACDSGAKKILGKTSAQYDHGVCTTNRFS